MLDMNERMGDWMNEGMDGWLAGWRNECMNRWLDEGWMENAWTGQ